MSVEDAARAEAEKRYPAHLPYNRAFEDAMRDREAFEKGYIAGASRPASDEQVAAAARALYETDGRWPWSWDELVEGWKANPIPDYPHLVVTMRSNARAALEAAREAGA